MSYNQFQSCLPRLSVNKAKQSGLCLHLVYVRYHCATHRVDRYLYNFDRLFGPIALPHFGEWDRNCGADILDWIIIISLSQETLDSGWRAGAPSFSARVTVTVHLTVLLNTLIHPDVVATTLLPLLSPLHHHHHHHHCRRHHLLGLAQVELLHTLIDR